LIWLYFIEMYIFLLDFNLIKQSNRKDLFYRNIFIIHKKINWLIKNKLFLNIILKNLILFLFIIIIIDKLTETHVTVGFFFFGFLFSFFSWSISSGSTTSSSTGTSNWSGYYTNIKINKLIIHIPYYFCITFLKIIWK